MSAKQHTTKKPPTGKQKEKEAIDQTLTLKKEQEQLQLELQQKKEQLLRCRADFENFQKRSGKECQFRLDMVKEKYISLLIDLRELLHKATNDESPKEGLRLIVSQIDQFFAQEQIKSIDCVGHPFDHRKHHAISTIERDDCEEDHIVEELKKGYMVEEKIFRPSHVIVAKKKESKENSK
ncbi:MAG: nucleotide exchange factor GrpE [Candidatus Babeliaceae bacterium]|nr:nucleotide exchange factor GrpE [Candidatus Babeliaceae bacterium]